MNYLNRSLIYILFDLSITKFLFLLIDRLQTIKILAPRLSIKLLLQTRL
jgi:hypothetical protein